MHSCPHSFFLSSIPLVHVFHFSHFISCYFISCPSVRSARPSVSASFMTDHPLYAFILCVALAFLYHQCITQSFSHFIISFFRTFSHFIISFFRTFIHSFTKSFFLSFIHPVVNSFIRSFIIPSLIVMLSDVHKFAHWHTYVHIYLAASLNYTHKHTPTETERERNTWAYQFTHTQIHTYIYKQTHTHTAHGCTWCMCR